MVNIIFLYMKSSQTYVLKSRVAAHHAKGSAVAVSPPGIILGVTRRLRALIVDRVERLLDRRRRDPKQAGIGLSQIEDQDIALATEIAPKASATIVVGLVPERIPKPQKRNIDQRITLVIRDQETGLDSCRDIKSRVCSICARSALAAASASF